MVKKSIAKKNKIIPVVLSCLLVCIIFTGCASKPAQDQNASGTNASQSEAIVEENLTAKDLQEPTNNDQVTSASAVASGANDFAFHLSAALVAGVGTDNFVCSPYSVWLPLAALLNATDEDNRDALLAALQASGISVDDVNSAASRMLYDLTRQGDEAFATPDMPAYDPLKIANAIFVNNDVTLNKDFAQTFLDYYRGTAMNVDFTSSDAVDAVNAWASENTDGLITDIVSEFDPQTVAAIANAIYFSDRWSWEFDPAKTEEEVFHAPGGDTAAFYMLREGNDQTYYEDDNVQATSLNFTTGGGMYIILPKDGDATGLLASMTNDYFSEIQTGSVNATGTLLLPRFSIESPVMDLTGTLTSLGVPLFDENAAPLTGGLIEENTPAWLSDAMHKAVIEVDEKGTTAAAVTVMAMATSAMPEPTEPFEMVCNKPFVFVLYGQTYDGGKQVLFTGVVNQPES